MPPESARTEPVISIVTPSYEQGSFIERTIESVLSQTYRHIEYIVVDGGSTDGTVDILESYDDAFRWVSEPDRGQSDAINKGWSLSSGDVVTWLNSDDLLADPDVVKRVAGVFAAEPAADIVYGDFEVVGIHDEHLFTRKQAPFHPHALRFANNFLVPSAFIRRGLLERIGHLDEELHWVMDLDLWLRALNAGATFHMLPTPMWKHRFHSGSNTVGGRSEMVKEYLSIQRCYRPSWLQTLGRSGEILARSYGMTLRMWTQILKLVHRHHVDNLAWSWLIRHSYGS